MLFRVYGMGFRFDDSALSGREDLLQVFRLKRRQGEKQICHAMPGRHKAVCNPAIEAVGETLLAAPEGKVSSSDGSCGQQFSEKNVGAKMRVVVAVNAIWLGAVKPPEFLKLGRHYVLERTRKAGMKDDMRHAMPPKIARQPLLMFDQFGGNAQRRELRRQVQMKAGIDAMLLRNAAGSRRVFHEHPAKKGLLLI